MLVKDDQTELEQLREENAYLRSLLAAHGQQPTTLSGIEHNVGTRTNEGSHLGKERE